MSFLEALVHVTVALIISLLAGTILALVLERWLHISIYLVELALKGYPDEERSEQESEFLGELQHLGPAEAILRSSGYVVAGAVVSGQTRGARRWRRGRQRNASPNSNTPAPEPPAVKSPAWDVRIEGFDDVFVRLSRCCTPVPGDEIIGFVTRGRGVSVHRADCSNVQSLAASQSDRIVDVDWS